MATHAVKGVPDAPRCPGRPPDERTATVLFAGCAGLLAAVLGWWAAPAGVRHRRIVVEGELVHNNAVTLRANVAPSLTGNFFTVDLGGARKAFEQVPWVRAAVRREFPNGLRVR
jgi:cell division protein FtsQ